MNNREKIEQSVISASAYNGNDTEGLLKEVEDVYKKAQAFDEIDNLIYEVFEMMNCFKFSFINENKELILDSESNIFFSLKDCANKLDLVVKFIHWVSRSCIENMSPERTQVFLQTGFELYIGKHLTKRITNTCIHALVTD